jgi:hypothetical protein
MSICSPQTFGRRGATCAPSRSRATCPAIAGSTRAARWCSAPRRAGGAARHSRPAALTCDVAADRPQGFVAALLIDEAPDGAQTLITRGFCNLTHRKSDTAPTPSPGEEMEVTVPLHGIGYRCCPATG